MLSIRKDLHLAPCNSLRRNTREAFPAQAISRIRAYKLKVDQVTIGLSHRIRVGYLRQRVRSLFESLRTDSLTYFEVIIQTLFCEQPISILSEFFGRDVWLVLKLSLDVLKKTWRSYQTGLLACFYLCRD